MNALPNDRLLRGSEVADIIGCSRAMAYRLMQRGFIPVVHVGGGRTVRVPAEGLREWIRSNTTGGESAPARPIGSDCR